MHPDAVTAALAALAQHGAEAQEAAQLLADTICELTQ